MTVLPYHHPLELVKRLGTLDVLSGGRIVAGVGVGIAPARIRGAGARIRGPRRAVRRRHQGHPGGLGAAGARVPRDALRIRGVHRGAVGPAAGARGLGRGPTRRSLRRAAELGDAWMPFGFKLDELTGLLAERRAREALATRADAGRPLKLILAPEPPIDPLGEPERTTEFLAAYMAVGATGFSVRFDHHSLVALLRADGRAAVRGAHGGMVRLTCGRRRTPRPMPRISHRTAGNCGTSSRATGSGR